MEIQRLTSSNIELVKKCDKLLIKFLDEESVYDDNFLKVEKTNSLLDDLDDENNILLVAKENDNVLGFLFGFIEKNKMSKEKIAHISFVYVETRYRKNKIASKLIDEFSLLVKKNRIELIEIKCYTNNEAANELYKKYGFDILWSNYRKRI